MKKTFCILLAAALLHLTACGAPTAGHTAAQTELTVFAAASLTESLTQIAENYRSAAPEVTLRFNFDSSGTLQTQIEQGAVCDLFFSAGQKQMNALADAGLIDPNSRTDLLENKVVLAVPDGNPAGLDSLDDLANRLRQGDILLAVGNSDVPVGQYTQKILRYFALDEPALAASGCLTYGSNVKEVTTQVREGSVDAGIIYATDAFSANLTVIDQATPAMCGQVIYPAAVTSSSAQPEAAQAFLAYLAGEAAAAEFEAVGFSRAE